MRWQRSLLGRQCNGGTTRSPELGARWVSFGYIEKPTLALACTHWEAGEADLANKWAPGWPWWVLRPGAQGVLVIILGDTVHCLL